MPDFVSISAVTRTQLFSIECWLGTWQIKLVETDRIVHCQKPAIVFPERSKLHITILRGMYFEPDLRMPDGQLFKTDHLVALFLDSTLSTIYAPLCLRSDIKNSNHPMWMSYTMPALHLLNNPEYPFTISRDPEYGFSERFFQGSMHPKPVQT